MEFSLVLIVGLLFIFIFLSAYFAGIVIPKLKRHLTFWKSQSTQWQCLSNSAIHRDSKPYTVYTQDTFEHWQYRLIDIQEAFMENDPE
jgi:hypothetical protein